MNYNINLFFSIKNNRALDIRPLKIDTDNVRKGRRYLYQIQEDALIVIPLTTNSIGDTELLSKKDVSEENLLAALPETIDDVVYLMHLNPKKDVIDTVGYALVYYGFKGFSPLSLSKKSVDLSATCFSDNEAMYDRSQKIHVLLRAIQKRTPNEVNARFFLERIYQSSDGKYRCIAGLNALDQLVEPYNANQACWEEGGQYKVFDLLLVNKEKIHGHLSQNYLTHELSVILLLVYLDGIPAQVSTSNQSKLIQAILNKPNYLWKGIMQQVTENGMTPLSCFFEKLTKGLSYEDQDKPQIKDFINQCLSALQ